MVPDIQGKFLYSLRRFFTGTFLSRVSGLGREVVMAASFGITPEVAAFWMAFRFSNLLRRLFGEGGLHAVFVPHYETLRKDDPKGAANFFQNLHSTLIWTLFSLILIAVLLLGTTLFFGHFSEETLSVLRLTLILLPSSIFICLFALNSSHLNCHGSFFLPSASPTIFNLFWIGTVLFLRLKNVENAIEILAMILVFAFAFQWLITFIPSQYLLSTTLKDEKRLKDKKILLSLLKPFLLGITGVAATQVNSALDALFARFGELEGPALLWYALRLQQLPLALFGVGLSGVLLPPLAKAISEKKADESSHFLKMACRFAVALMIPITFGIIVFGWMSVKLIYGRGEFTDMAVDKTTSCLWAYGVGLLPMTLVLLFAAAFYAMKNYRTPTLISLISVALNCFLNALFVFVFKMGAISVAYATAIAATFNAAFLAYLLKKKIPFLEGLKTTFFKTLLISGVASSITLLLHQTIKNGPLIPLFVGEFALFSTLIFTLSYLFKVREIFELLPVKLPFLKSKA